MAISLLLKLANTEGSSILAVVGAGHLKGMQNYFNEYHTSQPLKSQDNLNSILKTLEHLPPASRFLKIFPWLIVTIIITGFVIGFTRSNELGWSIIQDWVIINGSLAALGALLAAAHPITIISAFIAAPLTSLNPTIGAGMVTAAIEIYIRKPSVGDFMNLRSDTTRISGWWRNRVARTLLVFLFSTIGSAIGTYLAGYRIFEKLF